jgi:short-subunit dehydrogenase
MLHAVAKGSALVTGASTGIGAVYADRLARRGYDLILVARDGGRLETLAGRLRAEAGVRVDVLPADLGTAAGRGVVEARLLADPAITLLVNNAGIAAHTTLVESDPDLNDAMIALNMTAVTRLASAAARRFAARGQGAIINISSVLALAPERFNGVYSGTKAFVLNLSISMQRELEAAGVRVQAVLPGATRTEIWSVMGLDVANLPAESVMEAADMVDAALVGFDRGEVVTIPSLPDAADFDAYTAARLALAPNLSKDRPATRYLAHAEAV